ncbi:hypothetical protein [Rhodovulum viride]|uniref:hypothetical protein n=1 Tax=Rhodovulum viride TaxID=1231134 RepID=UPI001C661D6C|nr:hypothetical protein [Rhodovulum viride]
MAIRDGVLHVLGPEGLLPCPFDRLILASGATDRLAPVPGWQAPGVFSLGAAQIALKSQGVALGRRIVLAGSGGGCVETGRQGFSDADLPGCSL